MRHESDSFFDFDCEIESPGSPVDECEYLRLIESSSNTPHNSAAESGYACASAASSHSSSDGPYFDVNSENGTSMTHRTQQPSPVNCKKLQKQNHICQPHHQQTEAPDEVDSGVVLTKSTASQFNGYENHKDLTQQTLPSEGPDIKVAIKENPKQYEMTHKVQQQILQELHRQSLEYQEEDDKNSNGNVDIEDVKLELKTETEMEIESANEATPETKTSEILDSKQTVHIANGHAENGEDVLKIEVKEEFVKKEINEHEEQTEKQLETEKEIKTEIQTQTEVKTETESPENKETVVASETKSTETEKEASNTTEADSSKSKHLHMDTTDDEDDRPQRIRRCSSLKTGKTPPGTPGRKKIVRFADVLGLDLADVKTFLDEIPTIPKSAYQDLELMESEPPVQLGPKSDKLLMPLFQQPGGLSNFLDIVREKLVSLENAAVTDAINQTITGSVRVRNLDFHKSVHIRYSLDGWRSFADLQANYVENSCDGFSDKFTFVLFGNSLHIGQRLEFAVRFQCKGHQYWDNNYGSNYCFQCLPSSAPTINPIPTILPSHHSNHMASLLSPTVGETWCTSFY